MLRAYYKITRRIDDCKRLEDIDNRLCNRANKIMNRIKIDARHMSYIWRLPCITKAYKDDKGKTYLVFHDGIRYVRLTDGDVITYDSKTDKWNVELTTDSHKFNSRFPYTTHID